MTNQQPIQFVKATKSQARLRLCLTGPAGSGKTYTALRIAKGLGGGIAVVDTEHGSASKYAGEFAFDTVSLTDFDPLNYVQAIHAAEDAGIYQVIILDSTSHAWEGKGGALEQVDEAAARNKSVNRWTAWRDITPIHNDFVEAILQSSLHVIATMRTKTKYVPETDAQGNIKKINKVGTEPIQRDGMEYEFDVVADLTLDHKLIVSKTRCPALDGQVFQNPGKEIADALNAWLTDGAPMKVYADGSIVRPNAVVAFDTYVAAAGEAPENVEALRLWSRSHK